MTKWRNAKEKKPKKNGRYLVDTHNWCEITIAQYIDGRWNDYSPEWGDEDITHNVIAWQYLPKRFNS